MPGKTECVRVIVRCRPMNSKEKDRKCKRIIKVDNEMGQISIRNPKGETSSDRQISKTFTFDAVFDWNSIQVDVYEEAASSLVSSVIQGFNGTIFAYGQTGCGKTFTMEGVHGDEKMCGIIPRSFAQIFETIASNDNPDRRFLVQAAYLEIYNEDVRDLCAPNSHTQKLELKEDPQKGVYVRGLKHTIVANPTQLLKLMHAGNTNRSTGATEMNARSSRSHSIFSVRVETSEPAPGAKEDEDGNVETRVRAGKLNLVDLAGSERQSKTKATGQRFKEATKINLSLSALGNVISALVAGKHRHIPYRDSKLTRLLQDSLGGNTKTVMIAAISPADYNYDETLSTLRYAKRAKSIKNKPKINEDPKDALIREYESEIKRLKMLLKDKGMGDLIGSVGGGGGGGGSKGSTSKKTESKSPATMGSPVGDTPLQRRYKEEVLDEVTEELDELNAKKQQHETALRSLEEQSAVVKEELKQAEAGGGGGGKQRGSGGMDPAALERLKAENARLMEEINEAKKRHEEKKRQLESDMEERMKMLEEEAKKEHANTLEDQLKQLEAQMLASQQDARKNIEADVEEQNRKKRDKLRKHKKKLREEKLKMLAEARRAEDERMLAEEKYASQAEELQGKSAKLRRLQRKFRALNAEMMDLQAEHTEEKENLLQMIRDEVKQKQLYLQICEQLCTDLQLDDIIKSSRYDKQRERWILPRMASQVVLPMVGAHSSSLPDPRGGRYEQKAVVGAARGSQSYGQSMARRHYSDGRGRFDDYKSNSGVDQWGGPYGRKGVNFVDRFEYLRNAYFNKDRKSRRSVPIGGKISKYSGRLNNAHRPKEDDTPVDFNNLPETNRGTFMPGKPVNSPDESLDVHNLPISQRGDFSGSHRLHASPSTGEGEDDGDIVDFIQQADTTMRGDFNSTRGLSPTEARSPEGEDVGTLLQQVDTTQRQNFQAAGRLGGMSPDEHDGDGGDDVLHVLQSTHVARGNFAPGFASSQDHGGDDGGDVLSVIQGADVTMRQNFAPARTVGGSGSTLDDDNDIGQVLSVIDRVDTHGRSDFSAGGQHDHSGGGGSRGSQDELEEALSMDTRARGSFRPAPPPGNPHGRGRSSQIRHLRKKR